MTKGPRYLERLLAAHFPEHSQATTFRHLGPCQSQVQRDRGNPRPAGLSAFPPKSPSKKVDLQDERITRIRSALRQAASLPLTTRFLATPPRYPPAEGSVNTGAGQLFATPNFYSHSPSRRVNSHHSGSLRCTNRATLRPIYPKQTRPRSKPQAGPCSRPIGRPTGRSMLARQETPPLRAPPETRFARAGRWIAALRPRSPPQALLKPGLPEPPDRTTRCRRGPNRRQPPGSTGGAGGGAGPAQNSRPSEGREQRPA